jgi:DNA-binding NtrC family response regulator
MTPTRHILIVTRDAWRERALPVWLSAAGYDVVLVGSFADAKAQLEGGPHLILTDIKLGAYNGLHLAVRAHSVGIPVIVIGADDAVLQRDAAALNARWLGAAPDRDAILNAVEDALAAPSGIGNEPRPNAGDDRLPWMMFSTLSSTPEPRAGKRMLLH